MKKVNKKGKKNMRLVGKDFFKTTWKKIVDWCHDFKKNPRKEWKKILTYIRKVLKENNVFCVFVVAPLKLPSSTISVVQLELLVVKAYLKF